MKKIQDGIVTLNLIINAACFPMLSNRGCIYLVLVHSDYEHPSKTDAYLFFQIHIYNKYWTKKKKKVTSGIEAKEWSELIKVCPEKVYEDSWD